MPEERDLTERSDSNNRRKNRVIKRLLWLGLKLVTAT